jgi:NHLM bacteriocin system ABC transporter ATP-binding protein
MSNVATATSHSANLESYGAVERPASNHAFVLNDPSVVWVVQAGKLDLFLAGQRNGKPEGARRPLFRIEPNLAAFGVTATDSLLLIAQAAPGTALVRLSIDDLRSMVLAGNEYVLSLIENWVNALSAAATAGQQPPTLAEGLDAGETVHVGEEPKSVTARHRVAWISHTRGASRLMGNDEFPIGNDLVFPLSRHTWLTSDPQSEIRAVAPETVPAVDPEWRGLQTFGRMAMEVLTERVRRETEVDRERMRARAVADNALLHKTMLLLASPINKIRGVAEGQDACNHPVFLACQAIGARMGFQVKAHPDLIRGIPMADPVAAVAKASGIRARRVTLKRAWWNDDNGFLICFRESDNRPIAILPKGSNRSEAFDPVEERYYPLTARLASEFNPGAYVLYRPFVHTALSAMDLARFVLPSCRTELWMILSTSIGVALLALLFPFATGIIFDRFIPGAERGALAQMCFFLLVAAIASSMLSLARGYAVLRLQGRVDASVQAALWDRLLSLPVSFFRDYSAGDLAHRSMGISRIREILTGSTLSAVLSGMFSIFSFALLFYYSWKLALVATALVALAGLASVVSGLWQLRIQRALITLEGRIASTLLQFISGVAKFRVSGTEHRAFAFWARQFSVQKESSTRARRISNVLLVFNSVFPVLCSATLFYCYYAYSSLSQGITTGDFVAFLVAFVQFLVSVLALSSTAVSALTVIPIYERSAPILKAIPEVNEAKTTPGNLTGAIEFSHVTFGYKKDAPPVLRDISLKIAPGEFAAFVGASGSGKSTLFRLFLGFETADAGAIYYDSNDLSGLDIQAVRRQIGVVLQTSKPVNGSMFENIVGSAPLTVNDAWAAAEAAGLDADIKRMAMGMHTMVSDGGGGLSGGQRQRLLIARAIVGRPRILMFDEATSALDNRTQEVVSRSLESLQATRIVIAHRLSTIVNADRIFVLDKGSIVQTGTYAELVAQEGLFKTLAERQMV